MSGAIMVHWLTVDGEEHDESWPTVDAFVNWAEAEGLRCQWTAYEEDEDGDFVVSAKGNTG